MLVSKGDQNILAFDCLVVVRTWPDSDFIEYTSQTDKSSGLFDLDLYS